MSAHVALDSKEIPMETVLVSSQIIEFSESSFHTVKNVE